VNGVGRAHICVKTGIAAKSAADGHTILVLIAFMAGWRSTWVCVMSACGGRLSFLIIVAVLTSGPMRAEDLDAGKSGATLFTATCADCHRSPRGLAKNRFSFVLSNFLQQHYTSSAASAQVLTAYLQSVDAPRGKPQPRPSSSASALPPSSLRPPAPVPIR
jgi:hypothetical protein